MTDAKRIDMTHERAPGYTSGIATGIMVVGPTPDGFIHMEFVRDIQVVISQPVDITEAIAPGGQPVQVFTSGGAGKVEMRKEVLASIALNVTQIASFGASLVSLAERFNITMPSAEIIQTSP